ncbi:hypothetical protein IW262DRAFT_1302693 [Armillaria fumosa]|nr:hypothetical protein IW262DRAFT_1302693 [Armillaria fumosa]
MIATFPKINEAGTEEERKNIPLLVMDHDFAWRINGRVLYISGCCEYTTSKYLARDEERKREYYRLRMGSQGALHDSKLASAELNVRKEQQISLLKELFGARSLSNRKVSLRFFHAYGVEETSGIDLQLERLGHLNRILVDEIPITESYPDRQVSYILAPIKDRQQTKTEDPIRVLAQNLGRYVVQRLLVVHSETGDRSGRRLHAINVWGIVNRWADCHPELSEKLKDWTGTSRSRKSVTQKGYLFPAKRTGPSKKRLDMQMIHTGKLARAASPFSGFKRQSIIIQVLVLNQMVAVAALLWRAVARTQVA